MTDSPAVAAIQYVLDHPTEEPLEFLRAWMYGDFDALRDEWPNVPNSVFIGADSTFNIQPEETAQ